MKFRIAIFLVNFNICASCCECCSCCGEDYGVLVREFLIKLGVREEKLIGDTFDIVKNNYTVVLEFIKKLPDDLKWRMVIDGMVWNKGERAFDKDEEPGYIEGMKEAWDYMISIINENIDENIYEKIHEKAVKRVVKKKDNGRIKTGFRCDGVYYTGKFSVKEQKILKDEMEFFGNNGWENETLALGYFDENGMYNYCKLEDLEQRLNVNNPMKNLAKMTFAVYSKKKQELRQNNYVDGSLLKKSASEEDKILEIIARICQYVDRVHLFSDGNGRVAYFLLLNKLMIENNMMPVMWHSLIGMFIKDLDSLIFLIKKGQARFVSECLKKFGFKKKLTSKNRKNNFTMKEKGFYKIRV